LHEQKVQHLVLNVIPRDDLDVLAHDPGGRCLAAKPPGQGEQKCQEATNLIPKKTDFCRYLSLMIDGFYSQNGRGFEVSIPTCVVVPWGK
jgi:hypothetical protein